MTSIKKPGVLAPGASKTAPEDLTQMRADLERTWAENEVQNDLALFVRLTDARILWRAFLTCREHRIPVPEVLLLQMERWASALPHASAPGDVLRAMQLAGHSKKKTGRAHAAAAEARWSLASEVEAERLAGRGAMAAIGRIAKRHSKSASSVRKDYYEWFRKRKS